MLRGDVIDPSEHHNQYPSTWQQRARWVLFPTWLKRVAYRFDGRPTKRALEVTIGDLYVDYHWVLSRLSRKVATKSRSDL